MGAEMKLSLCIPTNGVDDLIFEVLDSIYSQNMDREVYEVIVMDNGGNQLFKKKMRRYAEDRGNLLFYETDSPLFLNEIDAYLCAHGEFIKFINHRTKLLPGTLKKYLEFIEQYRDTKPCIYFSNGVLHNHEITKYDTFDKFVYHMSYWSSWSTGMGVWREDLEKVMEKSPEMNVLFPHTSILFGLSDKNTYMIDDRELLLEIRGKNIKKGRYDLFYAFGVEYPFILCDLYRKHKISSGTLRTVLDDNLSLIAFFYQGFVLNKKETNYIIDGFDDAMGVFYTSEQVEKRVKEKYGKDQCLHGFC